MSFNRKVVRLGGLTHEAKPKPSLIMNLAHNWTRLSSTCEMLDFDHKNEINLGLWDFLGNELGGLAPLYLKGGGSPSPHAHAVTHAKFSLRGGENILN